MNEATLAWDGFLFFIGNEGDFLLAASFLFPGTSYHVFDFFPYFTFKVLIESLAASCHPGFSFFPPPLLR